MAIDNFIPTIWSARLVQNLEKNYVFAGLFNRNYEPDARGGGDRVRIGTVTTDITVSDYARNTDISDPQILDDSTQDLLLNQQKYFNFYVDDIDSYQSTPRLMDEAMRLSSVAIGNTVDVFAAGVLAAAQTKTANRETNDTAYGTVTTGYLTEVRALKRKMAKANIAMDTRKWLVVPPEFIDVLERYITDKGVAGNLFAPATTEQVLSGGFAGRLMGFDLYVSNNCPTVGSGNAARVRCLAGTMDAATYAEQIREVVAYRPEKRFGDAVKGLYVYGAKVTDADQLFELRINAN